VDHLDYTQYTAEQLAMDDYFQQWVQQPNSESNQFWLSWLEHYPHRRQEVQQARQLVTLLHFREDAPTLEEEISVWNRINQTRKVSKQSENQVIAPRWGRIWAVRAAVAAGLVLLGSLLFMLSPNREIRYQTAYGQTQRITLPDGSVVTLNANSTLTMPAAWADENPREVWLDGEAFFQVQKRKLAGQSGNRRFIVHTDDLNVEVLGTQFDVSSRKGQTWVVLNSGSVKLDLNLPSNQLANPESSVLMVPGERAVLSGNRKKITKMTVKPEVFNDWTRNEWILDNMPFGEVTARLEETFGLKVTFSKQDIAQERITGVVSTENLDDLLDALATISNLTITKNNNQLYITR
jgi:ferric-dicitrate binding protein FerR (iron transport regulator)